MMAWFSSFYIHYRLVRVDSIFILILRVDCCLSMYKQYKVRHRNGYMISNIYWLI